MKLEDKKMLETFYGSKKKPIVYTGRNHSIKTYFEINKDTNVSYLFEDYSVTRGTTTTIFKRKYILEDIFNPYSRVLQEIKRITVPTDNHDNYLSETFNSEEALANSSPISTSTHKVYNDFDGKLTNTTTKFYSPLTETPKQVCTKRHGYVSLYKNGTQYIVEFNLNEIFHSFNNEGMKTDSVGDYDASADVLERFLNVSIYRGMRRVYKESLTDSYTFNTKSTNFSYTLLDGTTRPCQKVETRSSNGVNPLDTEVIKFIYEWCNSIEKEKDLLANTPAEVYEFAKRITEYCQRSQEDDSLEDITETDETNEDVYFHEIF